jgi:predicted dehydrogenase
MNVLVLGAGRMGLRHCLGVLKVRDVKTLLVVDVSETSLTNAKSQLENKNPDIKIEYHLADEFFKSPSRPEIIIVASTAGNRLETCEKLLHLNPKYILVEKPLGQSLENVEELIQLFEKQSQTKAFVNLNTRLYSGYQKLKKELHALPADFQY